MSVRLVGPALLPAVLIVALTVDARAQTGARPYGSLKELSLEELGDLEVTTTAKQPETVWDTEAAIYVITQDDIRRSGATSLPDVLRLAPGVIVNQSDSNRWAVGVRGFADLFSKSVLVLIDGRSVYTPLVGGVHWAIQDVLLADVERIEVIRGPGASIWGANAMNGVINVITRSAASTHGSRLTASAGNLEHGRVSFRYGDAVGDDFEYRVYGRWFDRGPQFHADGADFDDWHSGQAGFRADWAIGARDTLAFSGDIYKTNAGERGEASSYTPPSSRVIDGRLDLTGGNAIVRWQRDLAGGAQTRLQAYFDRTNRDGFTFSEVRNTLDVDFNVRLPARRRHAIAAGAGARVSPSTVTQLVPALNFVPNKHTHVLYSAFVNDDIAVVPNRVTLSIGGKFEHNTYTGMEILPSARVLWKAAPQRSAWAALTRSVRTPSRFERDLRFQVLIDPAAPVYLAIAGSPRFEAETLVGAEAGYRQLVVPTLYVDVAVFNNAYDGLAGFGDAVPSVEALPAPHVRLTFPFGNAIEGTGRGFEITPDWKPLPFWQLKGSYSFLRLSLKNKPGFANPALGEGYLGTSPRHQVKVQSRLDLPGRLELDQAYRYASALPAQLTPAYHSLDARLGWRLSNTIELSAVGRDLLEPHHREFNAVPVEVRRSGYVQVVFRR